MVETQRQKALSEIHRRREKRRLAKKRALKRRRIAALVAVFSSAAVVTGIVYEVCAKEISITEIDDFNGTYETKTIKTIASSVDEVLEKTGISVNDADRLSVPVNSRVSDKDEIVLTRGKRVKIKTQMGETEANVTKADAADALVQAGYIPGENDEISVDGDTIQLVQIVGEEDVSTEPIAFETEYVEDSDLPEGKTAVISEGSEGVKKITASVTYRDGEEVSREIIREEVTVEPENRVIAKGTAKPTPIPKPRNRTSFSAADTDNSGGVINGMKYSRKLTMSATAYSTAPSENGGYSVSAMGTPLNYGIAAVDPSVIALGSKLYITSQDGSWTYGIASAEDTGGAIKGNRIDLCYPAGGAGGFGRRSCIVYVLE